MGALKKMELHSLVAIPFNLIHSGFTICFFWGPLHGGYLIKKKTFKIICRV